MRGNFHRGLDGMIAGGIAVFIAKLPVISLLGWEYSGTQLITAVNALVPSGLVELGLGPAMQSQGGLEWSVRSGLDAIPLLIGWILGLPFHIFGRQAFLLDNLLIWVGGWLIVVSPAWFWLLKSHSRERSIRATLRQRIARVLSTFLHRFR